MIYIKKQFIFTRVCVQFAKILVSISVWILKNTTGKKIKYVIITTIIILTKCTCPAVQKYDVFKCFIIF